MDQFKAPENLVFAGNLHENWRRWEQKLGLYLLASGNNEKDDRTKVAILLHCAGDEAIEIFNNFEFPLKDNGDPDPDDNPDKFEAVLAQFRAYCNPRKNTVIERYNFWMCSQRDGETFDQFVTELRTRAKNCEFGTQTDPMIRDRIIFGINDDRLRERLLRDSADPALSRVIELCRAAEASKKQLQSLQTQSQVPVDSVRVKSTPRGAQKYSETQKTQRHSEHTRPKERIDCKYCGYTHLPRRCPAYGKKCGSCHRKNHFAKMCPSLPKNVSAIHACDSDESDYDLEVDTLFIGELSSDQTRTNKAWFATLGVNGHDVSFKLDTGAEANVISAKSLKQLDYGAGLEPTKTKLTSYGGSKLSPLGKVILTCAHDGKQQNLDFFVADVSSPPILGLEACVALGLVKRVDSVASPLTQIQMESQYKENFVGLGKLHGVYHIELDSTVQPVIHPPRKVPYALLPKLQETLQELETKGVVARVDRPTDWVNSLVIVEKKNGDLRLCLDPRDLNRAIKREHFKMPTPDDINYKLSGMSLFTILDEKDSYWQVELDEESSYLCTFNTPFGRYRFTRMPYGISSASEVFQKKNLEAFGDIPGVHVIVDDMIISARNEQEHDEILHMVMKRASETGVKFNKDKTQFKVREVKYMGDIVSETGIRPDPEKVRAIVDMPTPECKADVQRILGMVNYLSRYIPDVSEITQPLRDLLKKETLWHWDEPQDRAIEKIRHILTSNPVLKFFDVEKPVVLQVDASQNGLGACILQEGHPVVYASRSLTDAERNYAQIEKELLAVVFGCTKFGQYTYGREVTVHSDHKPLEAILKKPLCKAPPRLQRMILSLQRFRITVVYKPGKELYIADTLSRAAVPRLQGDNSDTQLESDMDVMIHTISVALPVSPDKRRELQLATQQDEVLQAVKNLTIDGWPSQKKFVSEKLKPFWSWRTDIHIVDNLLMVGDRIIIPETMKQKMLEILHEGHLGVEKCKARARSALYWPGISRDIEHFIGRCSACAKFRRKNHKETLIPHPVPDLPWQKVGIDIFTHGGKDHLLMVDYFSKYPEVIELKDKTARSVIKAVKEACSRHGIPQEIMADNMPFGSRQFRQFCKDWDITLTTSSPRYAQSNGLVERGVQTVKNIFKKSAETGQDPYLGLLAYRTSPVSGLQVSPAQLLMSRSLRTKLPTDSRVLKPRVIRHAKRDLKSRQSVQKSKYDGQKRDLPTLRKGDVVRVKSSDHSNWQPAIVTETCSSPRSFVVTSESGQRYRRNRRDILKTRERPPHIIIDGGDIARSQDDVSRQQNTSVQDTVGYSGPSQADGHAQWESHRVRSIPESPGKSPAKQCTSESPEKSPATSGSQEFNPPARHGNASPVTTRSGRVVKARRDRDFVY